MCFTSRHGDLPNERARELLGLIASLTISCALGCSSDSTGPNSPTVDPGRIEGRVLLDDAPFSEHARLDLVPEVADPQFAWSRPDGRFDFPAVPAGSCVLRLNAPAGYRLQEGDPALNLDVRPGTVHDAVFRLEMDPGPPGDSTGTEHGPVWVEARMEDGEPVPSVAVRFVDLAGSDTFDASTGYDGNIELRLPPSEYDVEVLDLEARMPWLDLESIDPSRIVVEPDPPAVPMVRIVLSRNENPLPDGSLWVWVGVDSTGQGSPPVLPSVHFEVYRSGTTELVATLDTGDDAWADVSLEPGAYDVAMDTPAGFELAPGSENPARDVRVHPLGEGWAGFLLRRSRREGQRYLDLTSPHEASSDGLGSHGFGEQGTPSPT